MIDIRRLTAMSLFVALFCISAYILFPLPFSPVPVSALTMVGVLIGLSLPPKEALTVFIVYILLGLVGLPVFAGGTAGLGRILGPTGGYIISWPIAYPLLSLLKGSRRSFLSYCWRSIVITIPVVYIIAVTWLAVVTNVSWTQAFTIGALPFIPGDIVKCIIASYLAIKIKISMNRTY